MYSTWYSAVYYLMIQPLRSPLERARSTPFNRHSGAPGCRAIVVRRSRYQLKTSSIVEFANFWAIKQHPLCLDPRGMDFPFSSQRIPHLRIPGGECTWNWQISWPARVVRIGGKSPLGDCGGLPAAHLWPEKFSLPSVSPMKREHHCCHDI